jgi:putative transposase
VLTTFKYRLKPADDQVELLAKHFGCVRVIYNVCLQVKKWAYQDAGINVSRFDLQVQVKEAKREFPWLKEVNSQALQVSIMNLDDAYKNFYSGRAGHPKFKNKWSTQSFQCPQNVKVAHGKLFIPKFTEGIPIVLHRPYKGEIRSATVIKNPTGDYQVALLMETGEAVMPPCPVRAETAVGIDVGLKSYAVLSDGTTIENPRYLNQSLKQLQVLQRELSRKKKGSANRKKAKKKVSKLNAKIANQRRDFLHKQTDAITKRFDTICIEDLAVKNMVKNHHLARSISDASWGMFFIFLTYKAEQRGKRILKADRFDPSSKRHYDCGHVNRPLTLSDREWVCPHCGQLVLRDLNAAINIMYFALLRYFSALLEDSGVGHTNEPLELSALGGSLEEGKVRERALPVSLSPIL